jgi:hypothetical protein
MQSNDRKMACEYTAEMKIGKIKMDFIFLHQSPCRIAWLFFVCFVYFVVFP